MRQENILVKARKAYKITTNSSHSFARYPKPNKEFSYYKTRYDLDADITYIRIHTGFVYLAALIDGFSRKIVGYALGRSLSLILTMAALNNAILKRNTSDLIYHSDQGYIYRLN